MPSLPNKFIFLFVIGIISCSVVETKLSNDKVNTSYHLQLPSGFPIMEIPSDNLLTKERIELGEKLFFDVLLSKDSTINCSTCHKPELAFADTLKITPGINGKKGFRNAPSILNAGYFKSFMLDGGVPTLEIQVVHPLTDTNEMGFGINEVVERLSKHPYYSKQSLKAYNRKLDAFVITRALSAYERTLLSESSNYDRYKNGEKDALNQSEKNGMDLFFSDRLNCVACHSGFLFTNGEFENNGIKTDYMGDHGRERITHLTGDIGKFKVPSLRNVGQTFPYMHDGSFKTLEDVINHYNVGGAKHVNQNEKIKPLGLREDEKTDLIHFLRSI